MPEALIKVGRGSLQLAEGYACYGAQMKADEENQLYAYTFDDERKVYFLQLTALCTTYKLNSHLEIYTLLSSFLLIVIENDKKEF